ncbi:MAG: type II secretion system protein M [Oceanicoccus sp.]|uniref:type II secretion system protein M n=1 Tax=Oceanicoccus sp. TaxID=2691044 RepID=UPI002620F505|nr:type II secretion system protein M [Oceanicoccus sp.]MCP3908224.1 type II secretion system protein M [Oceanicoccus sp.]MDG1773868.1 type II secretion system protein M [Oceanicoccus sp.]
MQQWFNNLRRQEQLMLLFGSFVVLAYLLFVVILAPMSASVTRLEQQNKQAVESLVAVKELAKEYNALQKSGAGKSGSKQNLARLIDTTVKASGLTMNRFQPSSSGDVQVRFENAVFNDVIAWIGALENDHGVLVKDLSISNGAATGLVNVSVRLRQGG